MEIAALVLEACGLFEPSEGARLVPRALAHACERERRSAGIAELRAQSSFEATCGDRLGRIVRHCAQACHGRGAIAETLTEHAAQLEVHPCRLDATWLRDLDGVREDRRAARCATFGGERRAEAGKRLRIVGTIEECALVEERCIGAEASRAVRVSGATENVVPIPRALRERFELLEIGPGIAEAPGGQTSSRALPAQLGEARGPGDRGVEPGECIVGIDRELGGPRIGERSDDVRGISLAGAQQRGDCARAVSGLVHQVASEQTEMHGRRHLAQRRARGLGATTDDGIDLGDAPRDLGMPRRALERREIELTREIEIARHARVVGVARERGGLDGERYLVWHLGDRARGGTVAPRLVRGGASAGCRRCAHERDEQHAVGLARAPHAHAVGARRPHARFRQETARETARGIRDHEARTLAPRSIADERRERADGERGGGLDEVRAASSMHHQHELSMRRHGSDFERQRRERAGALRGSRDGRCVAPRVERDRRAERARLDDHRAGPGREEAAQPRLGPARDTPRVELDSYALELAALVAKFGDAAAHVEREFHVRQANHQLDDVQALHGRRTGKLDPEAVLADGQA